MGGTDQHFIIGTGLRITRRYEEIPERQYQRNKDREFRLQAAKDHIETKSA